MNSKENIDKKFKDSLNLKLKNLINFRDKENIAVMFKKYDLYLLDPVLVKSAYCILLSSDI